MSSTAPPAGGLNLDWTDHGDNDWGATAPGGWDLVYAGARFGLFRERGYSRFTTTLTLTRRGQAPASLLREGAFDQLAKRIGYAVEHQTGDADFDRRIYLGTDDPALARYLADRPEVRQRVLGLVEDGARSIDVTTAGWTVRLGSSLRPEENGAAGLSAFALQLCGLSDAWPQLADLPNSRTGWFNPRGLALAWFGLVTATLFGLALWGGDERWARQLDTLAGADWPGMGLLALVAVGPFAVLGGRRATSHRLLALLVLLIAVQLPFSDPLLQMTVNRLAVRDRTLTPATLVELRPDTHGLHRDGYEAAVVIEDRVTQWHLTQDQAALAPAGRLCLSGVVARGVRDLRFIEGLRTWKCRPGEIGEALPLPVPEP